MASDRQEGAIDHCPECGGDTTKFKSTVAYTTFTCVDCEWFQRVKTGKYQ